MESLISQLKKDIQEVIDSEDYKKQRQEIIKDSQDKQNTIFSALDNKLKKQGFTLRKVATGLVLVPIKDGQMISPEQFEGLSAAEKQRLEKLGQKLQEELNDEFQSIHDIDEKTKEKLAKHDRRMMRIAIEQPMRSIRKEFKNFSEVLDYLKDVEDDILNHITEFLPPAEDKPEQLIFQGAQTNSKVTFDRYRVNLIVDNSKTVGAPVIVECNPTHNNLIGRIDRQSKMGMLVTDFSLIKAGALHKANGGYLIIEAEQLFQSALAWKALKRAMKNESITITDLSEEYSFVSVKSLDPEPIPLDAKVIIIGNYRIYYALLNYDEEFQELFKVKADFNVDMPRTRHNIFNYARFIHSQCERRQLMHFDPQAVSRVVEYGIKLTGDQTKLSARFADIHDLIVESDYWARKNNHELVSWKDVQKAIDAKQYRLNKYENRVQEMFEKGTLFISTKGEQVGQVNGLSVINIGDYVFGKPSRISVRTYLGRSGVMAIDREVKMSGPIHNKGVLILSGYLNAKFGQQKQISMSASITFEQSYEGIDGDSASSTELYALLSSLAGMPIRQGIAVTGSVNQLGEIQPIGGVSYKIEGFFKVCQAKGLSGEQGVLIPKTNIKNLMLDKEVVDAVKAGKFHIYPVTTVEEGIEILTGVKAGKRGRNGKFPKGTVFYAVEERLSQMADQLKDKDLSNNELKKEKDQNQNNDGNQ